MTYIDVDQIAGICSKYSGPGFYAEQIPAAVLVNAQQCIPIPKVEHVIAFVDVTKSGNGKKGLAITRTGVYWNNNKNASNITNYLSWDQLISIRVQSGQSNSIGLGMGNVFSMADSLFKSEMLVKLLKDLQSYIRMARETSPSPDEDRSRIIEYQPSSDKTSRWMVAAEGRQHGPYELELLKKMVQAKQIRPENAHVWKEGMPAWVPFLQQPELTVLVAPPPAPQAPTPSVAVHSSIPEPDVSRDPEALLELNSASEEEIAALPGVGIILAKKAISVRQTKGGFCSIDEFMEILGLKPHIVVRIRPLVKVHPPEPKPPQTGRRVVDY